MFRTLAAVALVAFALPVSAADPPKLAEVAEKLKLQVVTETPSFPIKTTHGAIDGAEADEANLKSYGPIFAFELALYPPELIKKTRLKSVVFCKNLSFAGQLRTAVPDFEHDVLYFDVTRGRHDDRYVRKVIHHELFHIIDLRDDGHLYEDERWVGLNPPGFKYGSGGAKLQDDPTVTTTGRDEPGFLNRYAASGVEEDKAELFAHMIVEPKAMATRAEKDKYVRAKVERMRELLAAFSPRIDDDFWASVEKAKRPSPKR